MQDIIDFLNYIIREGIMCYVWAILIIPQAWILAVQASYACIVNYINHAEYYIRDPSSNAEKLMNERHIKVWAGRLLGEYDIEYPMKEVSKRMLVFLLLVLPVPVVLALWGISNLVLMLLVQLLNMLLEVGEIYAFIFLTIIVLSITLLIVGPKAVRYLRAKKEKEIKLMEKLRG